MMRQMLTSNNRNATCKFTKNFICYCYFCPCHCRVLSSNSDQLQIFMNSKVRWLSKKMNKKIQRARQFPQKQIYLDPFLLCEISYTITIKDSRENPGRKKRFSWKFHPFSSFHEFQGTEQKSKSSQFYAIFTYFYELIFTERHMHVLGAIKFIFYLQLSMSFKYGL